MSDINKLSNDQLDAIKSKLQSQNTPSSNVSVENISSTNASEVAIDIEQTIVEDGYFGYNYISINQKLPKFLHLDFLL